MSGVQTASPIPLSTPGDMRQYVTARAYLISYQVTLVKMENATGTH